MCFVKNHNRRVSEKGAGMATRWRSPPDSFHTTLTHQCSRAIFEHDDKGIRARFFAAALFLARGVRFRVRDVFRSER
jgi:hypothetical protein